MDSQNSVLSRKPIQAQTEFKIDSQFSSDNNELTRGLRDIKTRLTSFPDADKGKLVNWGYALADAGMRKHVKDILVKMPDPQWPFPEYSLN